MNIDKTKFFLVIVIVALGTFYFLGLSKSPTVNQKTSVNGKICLEETSTAINFYVNAEKSIFDKARAIVAMKNDPCLTQYPDVVLAATELVNKEMSAANMAERGVDALIEFEGTNGLKGFEAEAAALEEALSARTYTELEKFWSEP